MPQQIKRLGLVFAVLVAGLLAARHFLVPPTFGKLGHYRAAAIDSVAALPIHYAGHQACAECHDDIVGMKENSRHSTVSCEVCHGAALAHVGDPENSPLPAPRERGFCPLCHGYNPSRPTGFPQIDPTIHNPQQPCMACHDPHQPTTPHTPEECSACHGEIARSKAVSPHGQLTCVRCHDAPEEHKANPRLVRAQKPRSNELCAGCHGHGADAPAAIPRVDPVEHSKGYVCWQCHYPHHPEVK